MKLNSLFLLAAMGLGLFACNDNDLVEGNAPNGTQEEGTTYVGLSLKFASNTRATEEGTEDEQAIKTAYVIMADADGKVEGIASQSDKGTGTNNKDTDYYVFQTTPGVHYFYAVVNPDDEPTEDKTIDDYFNTAEELIVEEIISEENGFMMASTDVLTANVEDGVTEDEALKGLNNCFTIQVERVTAKVTMTCDDATLTNANNAAGGTITTPKFILKGGAEMSTRMAQNPFSEIDNNSWNYESKATDVYLKGENETDIHRLATPVYCLENIHENGFYIQGNTTYLTLKTTFIPANVVDCADEIKDLKTNTTTETFYVVKQGELAGNYIMASDLTEYQNGDSNKLPAGVEAISKPYNNGECWFGPIWIGQTNEDKDNAPINRNTWYNLKITGITLPGDPTEPQIDDEQPLVPDTHVAITLDVLPWNFIDREIDLQ